MEKALLISIVTLLSSILISCGSNELSLNNMENITLTSSAFTSEASIPSKYTCDGENVSPELSWDNVPEGTQSFALIMDDPDAPNGDFVHWVTYNIPTKTRKIEKHYNKREKITDGAQDGLNSWKNYGYGGPCPPSGTHRYYLKLYALDTVLKINDKMNKQKLIKAIEGHIIGKGELMGTYKR